MKVRLNKNNIFNFIRSLIIIVFFVSSICFWEESKLNFLMISDLVIILLTFLVIFYKKNILLKLLSYKVFYWIIFNFTMFEFYGIFFLRTGTFNWDFILLNGVLLLCLSMIFLSYDTSDEIIDSLIISSKISIIIVFCYMINTGVINFSNITFGSRLGDTLSGNVNIVATCLGILFLFSFYSVILKEKRTIIGIVTSLISVLCMLLTGSKKAIIILLVSLLMWFFIYKKKSKYFNFILLVVILFYMIFNIPILYDTIGFRIIDMFATLGIGKAVTTASSTAIRLDFVKIGFMSFLKNPLFGGGINYFQYINKTLYYSHNNYIEILNSFGIFGIILYYLNSIKCLIYFLKNKEHNRNLYFLCIFMIILKYILDISMVSFSSLAIFYLLFIIPSIIATNEFVKEKKNENFNCSPFIE